MNSALKILVGLLGGMSATGPMSIAMAKLHPELPWHQRHALPPRQITGRLLRKLGLRPSSDGKNALTLVNHFGYGAASGGVYAAIGADVPGSPVAKGMAFGFALWLMSYLGLLPALDLNPPATRTDSRRNALMILVHLIWGVVLALFVETMKSDFKKTDAALLR